MGKHVILRPHFGEIKVEIMRDILAVKFAFGTECAIMLERTGQAAIVHENYWHDYFWGVCKGQGEDWLGRLLTERREANRGL